MTTESPIEPTVGRIVLVRGPALIPNEAGRELPGIVTRVWSRNCINVTVFNDHHVQQLTSLMFDDDMDVQPVHANWRWMPYQVAKAAEVGQ